MGGGREVHIVPLRCKTSGKVTQQSNCCSLRLPGRACLSTSVLATNQMWHTSTYCTFYFESNNIKERLNGNILLNNTAIGFSRQSTLLVRPGMTVHGVCDVIYQSHSRRAGRIRNFCDTIILFFRGTDNIFRIFKIFDPPQISGLRAKNKAPAWSSNSHAVNKYA